MVNSSDANSAANWFCCDMGLKNHSEIPTATRYTESGTAARVYITHLPRRGGLFFRRAAYYLIWAQFLTYSGLYFVISYSIFAGNGAILGYAPTVLIFVAGAAVFADNFWGKKPNERYDFFGLGQNRLVYWFELNTMFLTLTSVDVLIILLSMGVDTPILRAQPKGLNLDLATAAAFFAIVYLISIVHRNALGNLLGQGYGKLRTGVSTRMGGTSIVGAAAFADLSAVLLASDSKRDKESGISRLRDAFFLTEEALAARRVVFPALDDAAAKIGLVASLEMELPFPELEKLATHLAGMLDARSPAFFGSLQKEFAGFSVHIGWPDELKVRPRRPVSTYDSISSVGTIISAIVGLASLMLYFVLAPGAVQFGPLSASVEGEIASVGAVLFVGFLSYRTYSRLSSTQLSLREWNVYRKGRMKFPRRPISSVIVSVAGGIAIALAGALVSIAEYALSVTIGGFGLAYGILGIIWGSTIVICGILLLRFPRWHNRLGIVIMICSMLSLFGALGGFVFGFIFGLVGGGLAITWRPPEDTGEESLI